MNARSMRVIALVGLLVAAGLILVVVDALSQTAETAAVVARLEALQGDDLEREQQRQEVLAAHLQAQAASGIASRLVSAAPFLTVLVAALGAMVTVWKYIDESARQRAEDRRQREKEAAAAAEQAQAEMRQREMDRAEAQRVREQAAVEARRRFDEKFAATIANLGDPRLPISTGAAVMLRRLLKPHYDDYFDDVYEMLLATVKLDHPPVVRDMLAGGLADALRRFESRHEDGAEPVDLARAKMPRVRLDGLALRGADVAFADLEGARFEGCDLQRLRGFGVNLDKAVLSRANLTEARLREASGEGAVFHGTRLVSVDLKQSKLAGADFAQGSLQSAHFEGADLRDAKFVEADVADAFFAKATLDDKAIRSLSRAKNWRRANLDAEQREAIERASKQ